MPDDGCKHDSLPFVGVLVVSFPDMFVPSVIVYFLVIVSKENGLTDLTPLWFKGAPQILHIKVCLHVSRVLLYMWMLFKAPCGSRGAE